MADKRYLLDTNILSDLVKNPQGIVAKVIASGEVERLCCTNVIVASELRYGAWKRNSARFTENINRILETIDILPLEAGTDLHYAKIRTTLEAIGKPIGGNDLLIAAHAISLDAVLVTANVAEFSRVENLAVENWLG